MESLTSALQEGKCDGCLKPSAGLTISAGDRLCERCTAVFLAAAVLLNEKVIEEDILIPTLVFAKIAGGSLGHAALAKEKKSVAGLDIVRLMYAATDWPAENAETDGYAGWELLRIVEDVPILRVRPLAAISETHPDTRILKSVRIQVLSRHTKPAEVGKEYERRLSERDVRWSENNSGYISYQTLNGFLQIKVGLEGTISPLMAKSVGADTLYSWPAYNFPSPTLVADIYSSLLGSADKRAARGFAYDLDLYNQPHRARSAKKIILAFAAWHIGEGPRTRIPPKSRPRVAGVLNRQLLDPSERLPDESWSSSDKVWRDVEDLARRFVRLYAGGPGMFLTKS